MTFREIIYIVMDKFKLASDDSYFTEEHALFLVDKYRAFLLKQRYGSDIKRYVPESNYQTLCLSTERHRPMEDDPCGGTYLRSVDEVPYLLGTGNPKVYALDYFKGSFSYVPRERMKYVGHNRFLKDMAYCTIGTDNHLWFKSCNPQLLYLENVRMTGVFQDPKQVALLSCGRGEDDCNYMDSPYPLEDSIVPAVLELIAKDLGVSVYMPEDKLNNGSDDMAGGTQMPSRQERSGNAA